MISVLSKRSLIATFAAGIICMSSALVSNTYALDYDAVNDRYLSSDYSLTVSTLSSVSQLNSIAGTHGTITSDTIAMMSSLNGKLVRVLTVKSGLTIVATGYLVKGNGDDDPFNRLLILSDGFDPGNDRKVQHVCTDPNFNRLINTSSSSTNVSPLVDGYDVCFIDYADGTADIRKNAKYYLKITEYLCAQAGNNRVVAGGFSMGGVVSRLALLYGQKTPSTAATISNIWKYLAIDSPMQGAAGICVDFQKLIKENANDKYSGVNNDAAKQMLFNHLESNPYNYEHDKFYGFLKNMGNYPSKMYKYSISNSDWKTPYDGNPYSYNVSFYIQQNTTTVVKVTTCASSPLLHPLFPVTATILFTASCSPTPVTNTVISLIPIKKTISFSGKDLEAGSTYNILEQYVTNQVSDLSTKYSFWISSSQDVPYDAAGNVKRPTFMPISSVFDLDPNTPANLKNASSLYQICKDKWSPFDKIYLSQNRYEHIQFESDFLLQLRAALMEHSFDCLPAVLSTINN